ncbi:MAG: type III-A CRISPR-associated protein Cas10/Csm1 [Methanolinea sp.]|nr:type III-A CRISPR-associated protein Cas10/Csm1 [Methanolinea sp.]
MDTIAKKLVLASLFHDIGKFMQRANVPLGTKWETAGDVGAHGAHARWSAKFIEDVLHDPDVADLVLSHHNPAASRNPPLARIVKEADGLSSAIDRREREDGETGKVVKEALKPVFSLVHRGTRSGPGGPADLVYPLKPLSVEDPPFPLRQRDLGLWNLSDAYRNLWRAFEAEATGLPRDPPVLTVLSLLRKYTSCIPSAVYMNEPDIPLYDHCKTTAAIAHCLLSGEKDMPFLFVGGDISGIQKFIFSTVIPEQARKGTAKRLRARSFWLALLSDAVAREIVRECGLFEPAVLWNTGGHFLILAPNTAENRGKVAAIERRVNEGLLRKWDGRLSLVVATHAADRERAREFASIRTSLSLAGTSKKRQKFIGCDLPGGPTGEEVPLSMLCPVCGQVKGAGDECEDCRTFLDLGTRLARAKFLLAGDGLRFSFADLGLRASYDLVEKLPPGFAGEVHALNSTDVQADHPGGSGFLFAGNTVPLAGRDLLTFSEVAQLARGAPRLGYLKADVDNLGAIFAEGIDEKLRSISRIHALSSQLQFFFSGYLNEICRRYVVYSALCEACLPGKTREIVVEVTAEDEGSGGGTRTFYEHPGPCRSCGEKYAVPKFSITYAGGDDLFVIGPWEDTISLACAIDRSFREFVCENPAITLSAGIAVVDPHLPVARAVLIADDLLREAKGHKGKARIAVFDECVPFSGGTGEKDLSSLLALGGKMRELVERKVIPKNMIYAFLALWEQSFLPTRGKGAKSMPREQKVERERLLSSKRFLPLLKYMVKRNIEERYRGEVEELVVPAFPWIRLPVYITSLSLRGEKRLGR